MAANRLCQCCGRWNVFKEAWKDTALCSGCGSWAFTGNVHAPAELYGDDYFEGAEYLDYLGHSHVHLLNFRRKLKLISRIAKTPIASALDIGCAYGFFLTACKEAGIPSINGFEISAPAIDFCRKQGHSVRPINADGSLPEFTDAPDLVTLWDVFEHVEKPFELLSTIAKRQRLGGWIAISTVDTSSLVAKFRKNRWRQFHPPTHLNYPTRPALRAALASVGYDVAYHRSFGYYRAFESYLPPLNRLKRFPILDGLRRWPLYVDLFDTQIVIAKKTRPINTVIAPSPSRTVGEVLSAS